MPELASIVEKVAHLKEHRRVGCSYGAIRTGAISPAWCFFRDRYTTVRKQMEDILVGALGGASIEYTARYRVCARAAPVRGRMPIGEALGMVDVRSIERELTLATRSWDDEFADLLVGLDDADQLATLAGALPGAIRRITPHNRRSRI